MYGLSIIKYLLARVSKIRIEPSLCRAMAMVFFMTIAGCSHFASETYQPDRQEKMDKFQESSTPEKLSQINSRSSFEEPTGEITILDAFAAGLLNHPKLAGYAWEVRAREAQVLQAGLLPNPEVELEVEEFGGTGRLSGFDSAETTLLFSQLIELGQKRSKRTQVAQLDQDLAAWDYEAVRVEILAEVSRAFIKLLAFQERHEMVLKNLALAQASFDAIEKRVESGATSPLDLTKARVLVVQEKLKLLRNQRELDVVRNDLAASWGSKQPRFDRAQGNLNLLATLPTVEDLSSRIMLNPFIARWAVEISQHQAKIKYERSKSVPDVKFGLGIRHLNESDDTAAVFALSVPFTIFDRNQGNIRTAQYELERAQQQKREVELRINTSLTSSFRRLRATHEEATIIEEELLPAAKRAYGDIQKAYTEGKLGYLDVLDAQRTLFDTQRDFLEVLVRFHGFAVEIESLIGIPLSEITDQQTNSKNRKGEWIHIVGSILIITAIAATMHPAYSEQAGRLSQSGTCEEHGIDKSQCFICDPSLREKGRLWCKEHSRYEDRCWACHPDLKENGRLFCEEHGLYEDECIFCHPETTKRGGDSDEQSSQDQPALFCKEHKVLEQECGICHPQLATELNPGQSMMIRFSSRQSALKAGLRTALPSVSLSSPNIETFCEVKYNENKLARITPLASGVIQRVLVDVGDQVKAGDILVEVNSAEIAEAKASFLSDLGSTRIPGSQGEL